MGFVSADLVLTTDDLDRRVMMLLGEGWEALEQMALVGPVIPPHEWVPLYWMRSGHACARTASRRGDSVMRTTELCGHVC